MAHLLANSPEGGPVNGVFFRFNRAKGQVPDGLNPPRPAGNGVWGHITVEKGAGLLSLSGGGELADNLELGENHGLHV